MILRRKLFSQVRTLGDFLTRKPRARPKKKVKYYKVLYLIPFQNMFLIGRETISLTAFLGSCMAIMTRAMGLIFLTGSLIMLWLTCMVSSTVELRP
jgi:hypothetical protein